MGRYRIYRPFSIKRRIKSYLNPFNLLITIPIWILLALIDIAKVTIMVIVHDVKWVANFIHYRSINYSHREIVNMIRNMSPREFEVFIAELYKCMGYKVELTPEVCDGGKDVIIYNDEGVVSFIECKHFAENNYVGREICQKLLGSMYVAGADESIIVTTGKFHKNAWDVHDKIDNLQLIDLNGIMKMVKKVEVNRLPRVFMKTFNIKNKDLLID